MNNRKSLPGIPANIDPSLRPLLQALVEQVEMAAGNRGPAGQQFVTLDQLDSIGAVKITNKAALQSVGISPSTVVPVNAVVTVSQPQKPEAPKATGGKTAIVLEWDYPSYEGHAFTEIWRSPDNDIANAVLVAREPQFIFSDPVTPGETYYYWFRHIGVDGKQGPWHNSTPIEGTTNKLGTDAITVTKLSSFAADIGTVTAGVLKSADDKMIIDLTQKFIYIR